MNVMDLAGARCSAGYFNSIYAFTRRRTATLTVGHDWEIVCFDKEGTVQTQEGEYPVVPGSVICLRHGETWQVTLPCRWYYFRLDDTPSEMTGLLEQYGRLLTVDASGQVQDLMRRITVSCRENNALDVTAQVLSLLSLLQRENKLEARISQGTHTKMQEAIRVGVEYMQQHYREKCTLKEIAAHAGRSPIYFHDVFRETMGMTPYEYIAQLRVEAAKQALLLTDDDPAEIAQNMGFCSQSYFNFVFKKATGTTPLHYRRAAAQEYLQD